MKSDIKGEYNERLESAVFKPLSHTSKGYYGFIVFMLAIIDWVADV